MHLDTPLLEHQNAKKCYETKSSSVGIQLGQILDKSYKNTKKPQNKNLLPLLKSQEAGYWVSRSRVLSKPPALRTSRGLSKPTKPLSTRPLDIFLLSSHVRNQFTLSQWGGKQRSMLLVLTPPYCNLDPDKALPKFLVWPLVNFCWLGKTKNPDVLQSVGSQRVRHDLATERQQQRTLASIKTMTLTVTSIDQCGLLLTSM